MRVYKCRRIFVCESIFQFLTSCRLALNGFAGEADIHHFFIEQIEWSRMRRYDGFGRA